MQSWSSSVKDLRLLTLWPDTLGGPARARPELGHLSSRVVSSTVLGLRHGCHEVARGRSRLVGINDWVWHCPHAGHALHVLVGQVGLAFLFALGQGHVQWLSGHDAPIHFCNRFSGLLWGREADEAEAFAAATFHHDLRGRKPKTDYLKGTGPRITEISITMKTCG